VEDFLTRIQEKCDRLSRSVFENIFGEDVIRVPTLVIIMVSIFQTMKEWRISFVHNSMAACDVTQDSDCRACASKLNSCLIPESQSLYLRIRP
jgi:hypothetical protein